MDAVLEVAEARKSFGPRTALDGATLVLRRGAWLGLLGPNGAGKTTLVRAIAGRVALDSGAITLLGRDLADPAAAESARRRLGLIPQEIALWPLLTARENLRAFGALQGLRGADLADRVGWALEWTGLVDRADSLTKHFSGGMKRRLNVACGVLHEPEVVLLDEPTVGVDPQSRERIWSMLDSLRTAGASLVLTTHQLDEAQRVCDRIAIIDHGRTIAEGTLEELVRATVGPERVIEIALEADAPAALADAGFTIDGATVRRGIVDPAAALPEILAAIVAAGGRVRDLHVATPTLQAVFLHLTGRELRE